MNWEDAKRRVTKSYREWLRSVCIWLSSNDLSQFAVFSPKMKRKTDWFVGLGGVGRWFGNRLLRYSKCIRSIYQCRRYGPRCGSNLKSIDMWTNCLWWTCCYSKVIRSIRYGETPHHTYSGKGWERRNVLSKRKLCSYALKGRGGWGGWGGIDWCCGTWY